LRAARRARDRVSRREPPETRAKSGPRGEAAQRMQLERGVEMAALSVGRVGPADSR